MPPTATRLLKLEKSYTYARQLCDHLDDHYRLFLVVRGLWSYYNVRAELQTAQTLGAQLLALAQEVQMLGCVWWRIVPWG